MFLRCLQLVNFRNFRSSCFEFKEGANTIIGENDSGKSNAITGLRILLDDTFYRSAKILKESDFSYALDNWKGHWIIISASFSGITNTDKESEICASLVIDDEENASFANAHIGTGDGEHGVVTLFIRPSKAIRKKLFDASGDAGKFNEVRNSIRLLDYEFYFTAKSKEDFCNDEVYKKMVGDLDSYKAVNPEDDDGKLLGCKISSIDDIHQHISLVYVDALRDVLRELHTPRNPIRKIIEAIESSIDPVNIDAVKGKIKELNEAITDINEITAVGDRLNRKLLDILGVVYSPEINLSSELSDEIKSLSKFIAMKPKDENDLDLLGLGHLNMIYLALKIAEFEVCRSRELLNIMVVEEPEAHIHSHIQKTLFNNLSVAKNYTQVLMTTHSVHLAESSEISRMNILKCSERKTVAMQPINSLDKYGADKLSTKLSLTKCIERYLDAKRNVLLFSKGVILVEGDAEEIFIPNIVKHAYGVTLDEIGVGMVNVGSTAFEYIASIFDDSRIRRYCSIITDMDKQSVDSSNRFYKASAEQNGTDRKVKLDKLYADNPWVGMFYAEHTFEIEFVNSGENYEYISESIDKLYIRSKDIERHKNSIKEEEYRNGEMLFLADSFGKGWFATILSGEIDGLVSVPDYITAAIAHASQETVSLQIYVKMLCYTLSIPLQNEEFSQKYLNSLPNCKADSDIKAWVADILRTFPDKNDSVVAFIKKCEEYCHILED